MTRGRLLKIILAIAFVLAAFYLLRLPAFQVLKYLTGENGVYPLGLASVAIFFSLFTIIIGLSKSGGRLSVKRRWGIIVSFTFMFIVLVVVATVYATLWYMKLRHDPRFFPSPVDTARITYETRNILGYADAAAIASIGVFLPLLILLWNSAQDRVSKTLENLIALKGNRGNQNLIENHLNESIVEANADIKYLTEIGAGLRIFFLITVMLIVLILFGLGCANFLLWPTVETYVFAVLLKGIAMFVFLWLLMLLLIYLFLVQPVVRDTTYPKIFGLDSERKGESQ